MIETRNDPINAAQERAEAAERQVMVDSAAKNSRSIFVLQLVLGKILPPQSQLRKMRPFPLRKWKSIAPS